jgi:hypothetical protein
MVLPKNPDLEDQIQVLNFHLIEIHVPFKFLFIHSAEKNSCPVQNGIFSYPRRVFSPFGQCTYEMISTISNPSEKFVGPNLSIIHMHPNEKARILTLAFSFNQSGIYLLILLNPISPTRPEPRRSRVEGSGTGDILRIVDVSPVAVTSTA